MFCKNCGTQVSDGAKFCKKCGAPMPPAPISNQINEPTAGYQQAPAAQNTYKQNNAPAAVQASEPKETAGTAVTATAPKSNKGKIIAIAAAAVIVVIAVAVCAVLLSQKASPSNKIIEALSSGNYDEAIDYSKELDEVSDTLAKQLNDHMDELYSNFKSGAVDYTTAKAELDALTAMNLSEISGKLSEITDKVDKLNASKTAFETAKQFESSGDYISAIAQYKLVIEEDANFEAAKSGIVSASDKCRADALSKASQYVSSNDYENALKTLTDALAVLENDAQITTQITVYSANYETACITKADALLKQKKFDEAKSFLSDALKVLPDSTKLSDKLNGIDSLRPVDLNTVYLIDSKNYEYKTGSYTNSLGNTYDGVYFYNDLTSKSSYSLYNINSEYSKFVGSFVADPSANIELHYFINIYVDDVLKCSKKNFTKTTGKLDFSVDVKGGKQLKIVVGVEEDVNQYIVSVGNVGIVNAKLEK